MSIPIVIPVSSNNSLLGIFVLLVHVWQENEQAQGYCNNVYVNRYRKQIYIFTAFAKENNCTISIYDTWNRTFIGMDNKGTNKLFFIRSMPDREIRQVIDISEVSDCRMSKTERNIKYDKEKMNVVDRIEVIFSFYNQKPDIILEFYNCDYNQLNLTGELQLAQKWTEMIKGIVNTKRTWSACLAG